MMDRMRKAEIEYAKTFNDNFPMVLFSAYSDEEITDLMEKCVQLHKTPEQITGRDYDPLCDY